MPTTFALVGLSATSSSRLVENNGNRIDATIICLSKSLCVTIDLTHVVPDGPVFQTAAVELSNLY
jgi:hypothetical protein